MKLTEYIKAAKGIRGGDSDEKAGNIRDDEKTGIVRDDEKAGESRQNELIGDQEIRDAFGSIELSNSRKETIWNRILLEAGADAAARDAAAADDNAPRGSGMNGSDGKHTITDKASNGSISGLADRKYRSGGLKAARRLMAAAAILIFVIAAAFPLSGIGRGPSLQGYVYAAESRNTGMTPGEVLIDTADPFFNADLYVYAPAIRYFDGSRLVFGNDTGLVIYNLPDKKTEGLIDMQAICSGYYNSDSVKTHVFVEHNKLYVYNAKTAGETEEPFGWYHIFDLGEMRGGTDLLKYSESGNDDETLTKLAAYCEEYEAEHLAYSWDNFKYLTDGGLGDKLLAQGGNYSENAYTYKGESGSVSAILVWRGWKTEFSESDDTGFYPCYELCTAAAGDDGDAEFTEIDTGIDDEIREKADQYNVLPAYKYTGNDPALKAICEYQAGWDEGLEFRSVAIPAPEICGRVKKGDELLVFGNFWCDTYAKRGNTLVTTSGGSMPACFHLVKDGEAYRVASVDEAADGELYLKSIKAFTKGHPLIYLKLKALVGRGQNEKIRGQAIRDYVTANGLDIKYYKDYGWDPMKLFED